MLSRRLLAIADSEFIRVADVSDIPPGEMKAVKIGYRQEVLLVNVDGVIHACDNWCNHQGYRLSAGEVEGEEVRCDLHGARFNVTTGEATGRPATEPIKVFEVRLDGADILIRKS